MNEIFAVSRIVGGGHSLMPVSASSVYVLPSYFEGTLRTVLEAMVMKVFILDSERIISMGAASGQSVEEKFNVESINKFMLQEIGL